METYLVLKQNKILRVYKTSQGKNGVLESLKNEKIIDYDEIRKIENDTEHATGADIREYDAKGFLLPLIDRAKKGLANLDKHLKIDGDKIVEKSIEEKIFDEVIKLDDYHIYDNDKKEIRPKTQQELLSSGIITQEEIDDANKEKLIQEEIRKIAIERLTEAGKL
jgi:hypothetical protein